MVLTRRLTVLVLVTAACMGIASAQEEDAQRGIQEDSQRAIPNWPAPLFWSREAQPASSSSEENSYSKAAVPTSPLPFIGIAPCRIADTRNSAFPSGYGPPPLAAGVPRNFMLTGRCGIPPSAEAVSLNITVTNTAGPGHIVLLPQGGVQPDVSTVNYVAGQTIANAAIVPLGTAGGITVIAASGTDLIIDVNGYYAGAGSGIANTFLGRNAGNFTMTGDANTGIGVFALFSNTTGLLNTASGLNALVNNTTGFNNTASGVNALFSNTTGSDNTASGVNALLSNTTGSDNTASGVRALLSNTTGIGNTVSGVRALEDNTTGGGNTASGHGALLNNTTGSRNTAVGAGAGISLTTGNNNICLDNGGVAGESGTIRIGSSFFHTRAFIAGVRGRTTGVMNAIPVLIDSVGQLGTTSSSARSKEEIKDMGETSSGLLKLRPVTFHYKGQAGDRKQFGLIAEEVEEVLPELVVHNAAGEVETVLYHEMPAMLLNELQKQQRHIERQEGEIAALQARLAALEAALRVPVEGQ